MMRIHVNWTKAVLVFLALSTIGHQSLLAQLRPEFRRKNFRVEFKAKIQGDVRGYSPELGPDFGGFDLHRARLSLEGRFLMNLDFQVEREVRQYLGGDKATAPWRDVYVNYKAVAAVEVQAGKFKMPFSQEQVSGESSIDFVDRSRIGDLLAPGRDVGVMLHGAFKNFVEYQAGGFRHDGDNRSEEHTLNSSH